MTSESSSSCAAETTTTTRADTIPNTASSATPLDEETAVVVSSSKSTSSSLLTTTPTSSWSDSQQHDSSTQPAAENQSLDRPRFLSQNSITGEIMPNRWTLRQLCKILCPIQSNNNNNNNNNDAHSEPRAVLSPSILSPESQLLEINDQNCYSTEGWKPAKSFAVLKEALALWYYQNSHNDTVGPLSCRQLMTLLYEQDTIQLDTLIYSQETACWQKLQDNSNLLLALEAFRKQIIDSNNITNLTPIHIPETHFQHPDTNQQLDIDKELQAFLSHKDHFHSTTNDDGEHDQSDEEEETYNSDGGTSYVKQISSGQWIQQQQQSKTSATKLPADKTSATTKLPAQTFKKRKRPKFSSKNSKCWIYISGLPPDCTMEELHHEFSKAGIIDLDPETQLPRIKIYKHTEEGPLQGLNKGDASICYARPESVQLAILLLDGTSWRPDIHNPQAFQIHVEPAKFQQHGKEFDVFKKKPISNTKRQVAKMAVRQTMDWDDGDFNGRISGGRKGLRIIVIQHLFEPNPKDDLLQALEKDLHTELSKFGSVEKITAFAKNPDGVVVVKFEKPGMALAAVRAFQGKNWNGRILTASFWDGVTDFTMDDSLEEDEEAGEMQRHDEFGNWLEQQQELPEEFQLQVEDQKGSS